MTPAEQTKDSVDFHKSTGSLLKTLSASYGDLRHHKLLALRAVITGFVALTLVWVLFALRLANLDDWLFVTGVADIRHFWRGGRAVFSHFLIGGSLNFSVGWIVGRLHRQHRVAMVSVFFLLLVLLLDLPRVIPATIAAARSFDGFLRFFGIALADFVFLRLPILVGGIRCVRSPEST